MSPRDLWYEFTACADGNYTFDICNASFDVTLSVYTACGGAELDCHNNGGSCGGISSVTSVVSLTSGNSYLIQVGGWTDDGGIFGGTTWETGVGALEVIAPAVTDADGDGYNRCDDCDDSDPLVNPGAAEICGNGIDEDCDGGDTPCNDTCATAEVLPSGNSSTPFDTSIASDEGVPFSCNSSLVTSSRDVWYEFNSCADGSHTFEVCGASYDLAMSVYTACGGVEIDCQESNGCAGGFESVTSNVALASSTTYFLQIGAWSTASGTGILDVIAPLATDADGDGFSRCDDCDDNDPLTFPGALEICGNGIDENCDGVDDICSPGTSYCVAAPNSASASGTDISATGSPSIAANDMVLLAGPVQAGEFGVFFHGANMGMIPFGEGFLCAPGNIVRIWPPVQSSPTGTLTRVFDNGGPGGVGVGVLVTRNFQAWYRDPAGGPSGFNLSNGLSVTFVP